MLTQDVALRRPADVSLKDNILGSSRPLLLGSLLKLYDVFEPYYSKTFERLVIYSVPKLLVKAMNAMLTFVKVHTRKKFVVINNSNLVCRELGWDVSEIHKCGGANGCMNRHAHCSSSFVFE